MTTAITEAPADTPAPPYLAALQAALDEAHEYAPRRVTGRYAQPATLTMCGCDCAAQHGGTTDRCTLAAQDRPGGPCENCAAALEAHREDAEHAAGELDDLDALTAWEVGA